MKLNGNHFMRKAGWPGLSLLMLALVGLQGCYRGGWHGSSPQWGSPEHMQERMQHMEERISDRLDIRPEQQGALKQFTGKVRAMVSAHTAEIQPLREQLKLELEKEVFDETKVAELLKALARQIPAPAEVESVIDEAVVFYRSLDAEQQEKFRKSHAWRFVSRR